MTELESNIYSFVRKQNKKMDNAIAGLDNSFSSLNSPAGLRQSINFRPNTNLSYATNMFENTENSF